MICVHNVVAAGAVVGMMNREGEVIRKTLLPMAYYCIQAGLVGQALITGNMLWWVAALAWLILVLFGFSAAKGTPLTASKDKPQVPASDKSLAAAR